MLECNDPVEALSAVEMTLDFSLDQKTRTALCRLLDEINRGNMPGATDAVNGLLGEKVRQHDKGLNYAMPKAAAVMPVLYFRFRGGARPKEGEDGSVKISFNPGAIQNILFIHRGEPYALALCSGIKAAPENCWIIHYSHLRRIEDPR